MKKFGLVSIIVLAGCSMRADSSDPHRFDAGVNTHDATSCEIGSEPQTTQNCGSCGHTCPIGDSDRCENGECRCGNEPLCAPGSDCVFGRCVPFDPDGEPGCEFNDACHAGFACIEGYCTRVDCVPEVCDGVDNDCDGTVDGTGAMPLAQYCVGEEPWLHPPTTLTSPCQVGIRTCMDGQWTGCVGDVSPVEEVGLLRCDGVDNNCDDCIDGNYNLALGACTNVEPNGFDVVYVVDISGSMGYVIEAVQEATLLHVNSLDNPTFRFALVVIGTDTSPFYEVLLDLTDIRTFQPVLGAIEAGNGAVEPSWDVVEALGNGSLPLAWRARSHRMIIAFTDERGQTPESSEAVMCSALTLGESLTTLTRSSFFGDFDECGTTYPLSVDATEMYEYLDGIIADPCR